MENWKYNVTYSLILYNITKRWPVKIDRTFQTTSPLRPISYIFSNILSEQGNYYILVNINDNK